MSVKKTAQASFNIFIAQSLEIVKNIILVPLFLRAWGERIYGEWLVVLAAVAYASIFDVGVQSYISNLLLQTYAKADLENYRRIVKSALGAYGVIILLVFIPLFIIVNAFDLKPLLGITIMNIADLRLLASISLFFLSMSILSGFATNLYLSLGEYPRRIALLNIQQIVFTFLIAAALFYKRGMILVSLLYVLPLLLSLSYYYYDLTKRHKHVFVFNNVSMDWKLSASFAAPSFIFILVLLANSLKINGIVLVVSVTLGAYYVTLFSVHRVLANLLMRLVSTLHSALWPEITLIESLQDYRKLRFVFSFITKISLFTCLVPALFLFINGQVIMSIWIKSRVQFQPLLWALFLVYLPLNIIWETAGLFQIAINRHRKYAFARLSSAAIALPCAYFAAVKFGVVGMFFSYIIVESSICLTIIPVETLRILKMGLGSFIMRTLGMGIMILATGFILLGYSHYKLCNSYLENLIFIIGVIISSFISYRYWLNKDERRFIMKYVNRLGAMRLKAV